MKRKQIVLASASERRIEILKSLGIEFISIPSDVSEKIVEDDPATTVMALAFEKALDVFVRKPESIVIGADTVVFYEKVLGKPANESDAKEMLERISGKTHRVYTGVAIISEEVKEVYCEYSSVKIKQLSSFEIDRYINTGEPMGKAGGYAIQGFGASLVESVNGDYFNVVGLPVGRLVEKLKKMGG
ncbi:MAG TPA: Maf family protein [Clostridia bacterium]|nr:Maf family protein [Clostridia bacterium]